MVVQVTWRGMRRDVVMTSDEYNWQRLGRLGEVELRHWPSHGWRADADMPDDLLIDVEGNGIGIQGKGNSAQEALDELDARLARVSQWIQGVGT